MNKCEQSGDFGASWSEFVPIFLLIHRPKTGKEREQSDDFQYVFTWFDLVLSFDSAGSEPGLCEQDVNRKKDRRRSSKFLAGEKAKSQPVTTRKISDLYGATFTFRLAVRSQLYYTRV